MFDRSPTFPPSVSVYTDSHNPFPDSALANSIVERFESVVERFPHRVAVESPGASYTFAEMNDTANRLARAIQDASSGRELPIALLFDHGAAVIVAIFACLKAGRCYVVLDPAYPPERVARMSSDSGAEVIVTGSDHHNAVSRPGDDSIKVLEFDRIDREIDATNPDHEAHPETPAVLIYTSGSTGTLKAAVHTHANVLADARNLTNLWRIGCEDRFVLCTSISFANSVRTIYASLLNGASLYPFDLPKRGFMELAHWLTDKRITVFRCVPTMFRRFAASIEQDRRFPDVRIFSIGGETVRPDDVELFNRCFSSRCVFTSAFGPTECLTVSSCFLQHGRKVSTATVPIGYPLRDKAVLILDDSGTELPDNEIGEINVRSRFITTGYWRKPDMTASVLSRDSGHPGERTYRTGDLGWRDGNGCFWHAGRRDFQVKIRGFRVEPLEIEQAMLAVPGVQQALAAAFEDESTGQRLVAYFVSDGNVEVNSTTLRDELASRLPDYMVPSMFVPLSSFPTLPNGKIDRNALPPPPRSRPVVGSHYAEPRTDTEVALAKIWQQALRLDEVGIDDPFLELGGDSLLATTVTNGIGREFDVEVSLVDLLNVGTIREIALLVEQKSGDHPHAGRPRVSRGAAPGPGSQIKR